MSIIRRLKAIFLSNANQLVDELDDPKISLNESLQKLEDSLRKIQRSLVDVTAARQRLAIQYQQVGAAAIKHQEQARAAAGLQREDLARMALGRRLDAQNRLAELQNHILTLDNQLETLKANQADLERKISLFRAKKEELGAVYAASRAQVQYKETVAGISRDLNDVGNSIQQAEARILEMRSRSDAIDALLQDGVLTDALEPGQDQVDRELMRMQRTQLIEDELARLKSGQPPQDPKLLEE
jgi:phage shock protein A